MFSFAQKKLVRTGGVNCVTAAKYLCKMRVLCAALVATLFVCAATTEVGALKITFMPAADPAHATDLVADSSSDSDDEGIENAMIWVDKFERRFEFVKSQWTACITSDTGDFRSVRSPAEFHRVFKAAAGKPPSWIELDILEEGKHNRFSFGEHWWDLTSAETTSMFFGTLKRAVKHVPHSIGGEKLVVRVGAPDRDGVCLFDLAVDHRSLVRSVYRG
jgi:hypothetical protein